tara:strand:+ start:66121 stop:66906 length:786 start_codon:yes stop_codon:yes gene_type:complete
MESVPEREDFMVVEIERFQGPLDLLLHLIRKQDVDIFDIPISTITDQFLKAIKGLAANDIDGAGEFLEMAAGLIRIKAQMLLPRPVGDEEEDPRAELVRRLLEYELIREVSGRLRVAQSQRARRFRKAYIPPRIKRDISEMTLETTWDEVYAAALHIRMPLPRRVDHQVSTRTVSMEEKATLILEALKENASVQFSKLLSGFKERSHGVMTFLAGLELTRRRVLFLRQSSPFQELWIYRRDEEEVDDELVGKLDPEKGVEG